MIILDLKQKKSANAVFLFGQNSFDKFLGCEILNKCKLSINLIHKNMIKRNGVPDC